MNITLLGGKLREKPSPLDELPFCDCNRELLVHATCHYVLAVGLPRERRSALKRLGITDKSLKSHAKKARELSEFLTWLCVGKKQTRDGREIIRPTPEAPIPMEEYFRLKGELEYIARSIDAVVPYRIETNDAARAIELHVRRKTGEPYLQEIANLLTFACKLAEVHYGVNVDSLRHQVKSGKRTNAESLLSGWDTLTRFPASSYNLEKQRGQNSPQLGT